MDTQTVSQPEQSSASGWLAFSAIILLSLPYVFFSSFNHMKFFDDEGTLMVGFRSLLEGHRMYDEIYSLYGPLYNGIYGLIYAGLHVPLTHTAARTITAILWVGYSAAFAVVCFRMTASRIAAALCYVLTLIWLNDLVKSPGHPEEISLLILAMLLLAIEWMARVAPGRGRHLAAAAAGGLVAGLMLVKINVGVFAGECLLLLLVRLTAPGRLTRSLSLLLGLLLLITPAAVSVQILGQGWVQVYVWFATLTIGATLAVFFTLKLPVMVTRTDWIGVLAGGLVVCAIVIGGTMAAGSSAYAVLDAVVLQNTQFVRNWYIPMNIGAAGGIAALASVGLALAFGVETRRARTVPAPQGNGPPRNGILTAKLAFLFFGIVLFRFPGMLFQVLTPFCWLLMVVPAGTAPRVAVLRAAAGLLGALLVFYPFPVAGHQINIGALMCVIALPVLGHDIMAGGRPMAQRRGLLAWNALLVSAALLLLLGGGVTFRAGRVYLKGTPLGLPGTALIRLPPEKVARLRWVTRNLQACHSSYSLPGLYSFAFWTGHALPTPLNINHVLGFIRPDRQKLIVAALRQSPDLCIVYDGNLLRFLDRGQIAQNPPLLRYIRSEFVVAAKRGDYAILKRKPAPPTPGGETAPPAAPVQAKGSAIAP